MQRRQRPSFLSEKLASKMLVTEANTPMRTRAPSNDSTTFVPTTLKLMEKLDDLPNLQETSTSTNNTNEIEISKDSPQSKENIQTPQKDKTVSKVKYETAHQLSEAAQHVFYNKLLENNESWV
jgi:hypothetical protein